MRILVTAGSTRCPIDKVRAITNIFRGQTGVNIALEAAKRGHEVLLLGSPEACRMMDDLNNTLVPDQGVTIVKFRTFDDLEFLLKSHLGEFGWDAVVQSAAVSDYKVDDVFHDAESAYNFLKGMPEEEEEEAYTKRREGKIESQKDELWMRLTPTTKLVDSIREWGLGEGTLVKFKLEVGVTTSELITRAKKSREDSNADLMVANRLDDFSDSDWYKPTITIIDRNGEMVTVSRENLPASLINLLESENKLIKGE